MQEPFLLPVPTQVLTPEEQYELAKVRKLARRLRRANPVRQIAFALLEGGPQEVVSAQPLLEVLAMPSEARWRERAVAAWAVGRVPMDDDQKEEAAQLLCRVATNQQMRAGNRLLKRAGRAALRTMLFSLIPIALYPLILFLQYDENGTSRIGHDIASLCVLFLLFIFCVLSFACVMFPLISFRMDCSRNDTVREFSVRSLGRLCRPTSISTLANLRLKSGHMIGPEAYRSLGQVLPHLTHEHYPLHSGITPALCRLLKHPDERDEVCFALLDALGKVGDSRAVQPIERLTRRSAPKNIREAAKGILPVLLERQRREKEPHRLVRSADAPEAGETLLRPAAGSGPSEPQALLRAVSSDETSREADGEP